MFLNSPCYGTPKNAIKQSIKNKIRIFGLGLYDVRVAWLSTYKLNFEIFYGVFEKIPLF
jgi:hypothetical protein